MNRCLLFCLTLLTLGNLAHANDDFVYPVENPFLATIAGTPSVLVAPVPEEVDVRQTDLAVTVIPERKSPPVPSRYRQLHYRLAWQDTPAPLVLLIAGTGSSYSSPRLDYLKRVFWQAGIDRKSTRLNSSHVKISYAVFCLKKKKSLNAHKAQD